MKGLLYSIMAALIVIPIFGIIFFHSEIGQENIDISIRANELKYFADSVESDLKRFIEITGKRALISAVSNITVTGPAGVFDDARLRIAELVENGTIKGIPSPLVDEDNLGSWREKIDTIASNSGFSLLLESIEVNVTQNDSFHVLFEIKTLINISDRNAKMGVLRNITATSLVSIEGVEDPLMPLNTLGRVFRVIRKYNLANYTKDVAQGTNASLTSISGNATFITNPPNPSQKIFITNNMSQDILTLNSFAGIVSEEAFVPIGLSRPYIANATGALTKIKNNERLYLDSQTKKVWDLENLTTAIAGGYYSTSSYGPTFLDRLEGRLTVSGKYGNYGIETIIELSKVTDALGIPYTANTYSCVDYEYWNKTSGRLIRNEDYDPVFNWFRVDSNHANIYGVNELII